MNDNLSHLGAEIEIRRVTDRVTLSMSSRIACTLGLDFGTLSCRAVIVAVEGGATLGSSVVEFARGIVTHGRPESIATQHPDDWERSARRACSEALSDAGVDASSVMGVGVDFTACTLVPCLDDSTPLVSLRGNEDRVHAWPKLWKHRGALRQAAELTAATVRADWPHGERFGGKISEQWLHPKAMELWDEDRSAFDAADLLLEAGDWFVWRMAAAADTATAASGRSAVVPEGAPPPIRSACQAGYKACWSSADGGTALLPDALLDSLRPGGFAPALAHRMRGRVQAPGARAGTLGAWGASLLGLASGTPIATSTIDAHAAVPGSGAGAPHELVLVLGTSGCFMLNAPPNADHAVHGCLGRVPDGILPGLVGFEAGQSALGDAFAWLSVLTGQSVAELAAAAAAEKAAARASSASAASALSQPLLLDFLNGSRSPYNDGMLQASASGLTLGTTPAGLYNAIADGLACGTRGMVDAFGDARDAASGDVAPIAIERVIAAGGIARSAPAYVQTLADALQRQIEISPVEQASAQGAAILGAVAAGVFPDARAAVGAMTPTPPGGVCVVRPELSEAARYDALHARYCRLAELSLEERG